MSTRGRMMEIILDRYNLMCINKKEETYYRALHGRKSTMNLTIASLMIAQNLNGTKNINSGEVITSPSS